MCAKRCETVEIWTVFIWQFITYCRLSLFYQSWYNVEVMFAKGFCGFLWFHMLKRCNEKDLVRYRHVHALGIWHAAFGRSQSRIDDAVEASFDSRIGGIGDLKVQSSDVLAKSPINDHVDASWIQYLQRTCWGFCKRWTRTACHPMYTSYTFMQIIHIHNTYQHVQIKIIKLYINMNLFGIERVLNVNDRPVRWLSKFSLSEQHQSNSVDWRLGTSWHLDVEDHCQCPFGAAGREVRISESCLKMFRKFRI